MNTHGAAGHQTGHDEPAATVAVDHRLGPRRQGQRAKRGQGYALRRQAHLLVDGGRQHDQAARDPGPGTSQQRRGQDDRGQHQQDAESPMDQFGQTPLSNTRAQRYHMSTSSGRAPGDSAGSLAR